MGGTSRQFEFLALLPGVLDKPRAQEPSPRSSNSPPQMAVSVGWGPILDSLYEGAYQFRSILGAPDFWKLGIFGWALVMGACLILGSLLYHPTITMGM